MTYLACDFGTYYDRCTENFRVPPRGYYTVCDKHVDKHVPALDFSECEGSFGACAGEITFDADPYAADVNGDDTPVWMCDSCRCESGMEI